MCMIELGELESHHAEFARRNARVVVVSVEGRKEADQTQEQFPHLVVVADADQQLASAVDLLHRHAAPDGGDTATPTTLLIDRHGQVKWLFRPDRVFRRLSAEELLAAVDQHLPRIGH
jgi:peroxiredoxin